MCVGGEVCLICFTDICVSFVPGTYLGGPINPNFKPDSWDLSEDYTFFKNGSFTARTFLGYLKQLIEN